MAGTGRALPASTVGAVEQAGGVPRPAAGGLTRGRGRAVVRELPAPFLAPQTRFSGSGCGLPRALGSEGGESGPVRGPYACSSQHSRRALTESLADAQRRCVLTGPEPRGCHSPRAGRRRRLKEARTLATAPRPANVGLSPGQAESCELHQMATFFFLTPTASGSHRWPCIQVLTRPDPNGCFLSRSGFESRSV